MWLPQFISGLVAANAGKSVRNTSSQPIAIVTKEIALTEAEKSLAKLFNMNFTEDEADVRERLTGILDAVESRDYSSHSDTLRPLLADIENPYQGGVCVVAKKVIKEKDVSEEKTKRDWKWQYSSAVTEEDTITHSITLLTHLNSSTDKKISDEAKVMSLVAKTTLKGRIKSIDAKYHIDCSIIMKDFVRNYDEVKRTDNIGTRHIEMDFTDGSRVEVTETEYFLDLLKEQEITSEELKRFLIGSPIIYPPLINPSLKQK